MVQSIHLVRHGHHALLGQVLCGRVAGVQLDDLGCRQMARCAELMRPAPSAVQASPQPRARQSAAILAWHFRRPVEIVPAVDEIDCGDWTGQPFAALTNDPRWIRWNDKRGASRPPNGECMHALQRRVVEHVEQLGRDRTDGTIVIVSHAEPIRAALLHYAGIPLDNFLSIEVDPASISTLAVDETGIRIAQINQRVAA
ncbi:histidine phosphatase family protein [Bradyrhizobium sp. BRP22]|uniref:histidine phosphatase family protein n=1 Tax=Bradyrhizobium sp. BRP22 TaxID=2793821 RepID=UPI001CD2946C|nr:histidine phosphatase family protein [Bradyrhizobium sp. BRP22]MCA1454194.1 histidine phosphatase family protein [Bradyrhizobium sp. BRP22]